MKKIIALVLVAILCLSATGCTEKTRQAELYLKYAEVIDQLEAKEYNGAVRSVMRMATEEKKANEEPQAPVAEILCQYDWSARSLERDENVPSVICFNEDGTCTIDGKSYSWLEEDSSENGMNISILEDGEHVYYVCMYCENRNKPTMTVYQAVLAEYGVTGGKHISDYCHDEMLPYFYVGWQQMGATDQLKTWLSFNSNNVSINDHEFRWEIVEDGEGSLLTVHATSADGSIADTYTIHLQQRDGLYVLNLTKDDSDLFANYYCDYTDEMYAGIYGKLDTWPEVIYDKAMQAMRSCVRGYTISVDDVSLTKNQTLAYTYSLFEQVKDFRDSAEYMDRFNWLTSQLVKIDQVTIDQLNNERHDTIALYNYNPDGTLANGYGADISEKYGFNGNSNWVFAYNNGILTSAEQKSNYEGATVYGAATPTYDETGRLTAMNVQTTGNPYTSSFTYDEAGRLATASINNEYRVITYTYDPAGLLIQKVIVEDDGYRTYTEDYTYTNGVLTHVTENVAYRYSSGHVIERAITPDAQGCPLRVDITSTNTSDTYKSRHLDYIYEDYFFVDITGLEEKFN